jgi:hypothetical protein
MATAKELRAELDRIKSKHGVNNSQLRQLLKPKTTTSKGSTFERWFAKRLGVWWCNDDAAFWRTAGSGARATVRAKIGLETLGQYGDVMATGEPGRGLIERLTIELKRGYNSAHVGDLMDRADHHETPVLQQFFEQANKSHQQARSVAWVVVHQRDRREPVVYAPLHLFSKLQDAGGCSYATQVLSSQFICGPYIVGCLPLKRFFSSFSSSHFQAIQVSPK